MADGFKVADAYIAVHTDDDTRAGRRKIERDTTTWARGLGLNLGGLIGKGLVTGILGAFMGLLKTALLVGKLAILAAAVGVVASAIAALGGAVVNLLPFVADLVSAAVAAAGALLLIPAAIATLVVTMLTLKLALNGVGDALKAGLAGDVEKVNEALEKLAPNAQAFVREVVEVKPAFDRMRLQIQNTLFAELAGLLKVMAEVYLPIITTGLDAMARVINGTFRSAMLFLLGSTTQVDIGTILANAATAAGNFARAMIPALGILRDVFVVSTTVFAQLTGGLLPTLTRWADVISQMREDGSLAALITDGLSALKDFVGLAGDLIGILRGIFRAAGGAEGGGIFGVFERLNELVNSVSGQAALTQLFEALSRAAIALTPVLLVLLTVITPLLSGIADIAEAFAPGLTILVSALGAALTSLAPAIISLEPLFTVLAAAVVPLAEIISGLLISAGPGLINLLDSIYVVLQDLAPIAPSLGAALGVLFTLLGDLLEILSPVAADLLLALADAVSGLAAELEPLIRESLPLLKDAWIGVFQAVLPVLPALIAFFGQFIQVVLEHRVELLAVFFQLVELLEQFGAALAEQLIVALIAMLPLLPDLVESFIELSNAFLSILELLAPMMPFFADIFGPQAGWQAGLMILIGSMQTLSFGIALVRLQILFWVDVIKTVWSWILRAIDAVGSFASAIRARIGEATGIFQGLWNLVTGFANQAGNLLFNAGRDLINGLIRGIRNMLPGVGSAMSSVAQIVRDYWPFSPAKRGPLSGRGDMRFAGQNLVSGLITGLGDKANDAAAAAAALAGLFGGPPAPGVGGPAFAGAPGGSGSGDTYVLVKIGDKPVRDMVRAEVVSDPELIAETTNEGHRLLASSGRKRMGDT